MTKLKSHVSLPFYLLNLFMALAASDQNSVLDFAGQLTNFLNEGSTFMHKYQLGYLPNNKFSDELIESTEPEIRPYQTQQFGQQYPPSRPQRPFEVPNGAFNPQDSFIGALSSIARHDDLRCVPRILCEITAGTLPEKKTSSSSSSTSYPHPQKQQSSVLPFFSKDALITLLTVLNFVDNSPMLLFGRAALLGYTARGNAKSCLAAYPTCPKDSDQLVDYLNNYHGGFFKFFNQRYSRKNRLSRNSSKFGKLYRPRITHIQYAPENQKYISDRILNGDPITISSETDVPSSAQQSKDSEIFPARVGKKIVFREDENAEEDRYYKENSNYLSVAIDNGKVILPDRVGKYLKYKPMIFPNENSPADVTNDGNELYTPDDRKVVPSKVTYINVKMMPKLLKFHFPSSNFKFNNDY